MLNVSTFLDLGCAPGGFSKWLLQSNQVSRGFGLSLPASDAGLPILMADWNERSRYKFVEANILDDPESFYPLIHEFFSQTRVDLVVCGARHRDAKTLLIDRVSDRESCDYSCNDRLILSQLLIAFRTLAAGGTLILVASMKISFRITTASSITSCFFANISPFSPRLRADTCMERVVPTISSAKGSFWTRRGERTQSVGLRRFYVVYRGRLPEFLVCRCSRVTKSTSLRKRLSL